MKHATKYQKYVNTYSTIMLKHCNRCVQDYYEFEDSADTDSDDEEGLPPSKKVTKAPYTVKR